MADEFYLPEEEVPATGIYQALHYRHRVGHEVVISRGRVFPACSECGNNLRFRLVRAAPHIYEDRNFPDQSLRQAAGSGER